MLAPDPRNTVLFVGFQAAGTRGGSMIAGARSVKIHGEPVPADALRLCIEEQLGWNCVVPEYQQSAELSPAPAHRASSHVVAPSPVF